jgi:membrane protease YdiL (CAAX protease family)
MLLGRSWWLVPLLGLGATLLVVGIDEMFFGGVTVRRLPGLGSHPPIGSRILVALFGAVMEEAFYRLLIATLVAWLAYCALSGLMSQAKAPAQWLGILAAAIIAGAIHIGSPPDAVRVVTVNGLVAVIYGWLYWWRGLELAILTHMAVYAFLYIAVPALR